MRSRWIPVLIGFLLVFTGAPDIAIAEVGDGLACGHPVKEDVVEAPANGVDEGVNEDPTSETPDTDGDVGLYAQADALPAMDAEVNEENALAILKAYDPDGYHMVSYMIEVGQSSFSSWLHTDSNAASLDTAVHEECHGYTHFRPTSWNAETIYTGSGSEIEVDMDAPVDVFPTSEMAALIPEELRTFRYDTYVSEGSTTSSNVSGPFGLLNEFCAYSWGMHNQLCLFEYYRDYRAAVDPLDVFSDFVSSCANNRQAYAEFRYWTLRYLAYAKENHPEVYDYFMNNRSFVDAYCTTQSRFETMIAEFEGRLDDIVAYGNTVGYSVEFENGMFWSYNSSGYGRARGIDATEYQLMMSEIAKPEYQAIDAALHGQTVKDLTGAVVAAVPQQVYDGSPVEPELTVTLDGQELTRDVHYAVMYFDNEGPGIATVAIRGVGFYTGWTEATFRIVPAAPTLSSATPRSATTVGISWDAPEGTDFVEVWRSTDPSCAYGLKSTVCIGIYHASDGASTSKLLVPGTTYYYKVRGYAKVDGRRYYSGYSQVLPARTPALSAPSGVTATPKTPTTVGITWEAPAGTSFVQVWRADKAGASQSDYVCIGVYYATDGASTSRLLRPGRTYYYKVRGYAKVNGHSYYSGYSPVVSATTPR